MEKARRHYIKAVETLAPALMKCLEVEDGLYLAGTGFVVTHNSMLISDVARVGMDSQPAYPMAHLLIVGSLLRTRRGQDADADRL